MACSDDIIESARCRAGCLRPRWSPCGCGFRQMRVLRDRRIEMVAHHQHLEMLVDGVRLKAGSDWSRTAHVPEAATLMMSARGAAGALGVESMNGAALERLDRVLDEPVRSAYRCGSSPGCRNRRRPTGNVDRRRCRAPSSCSLSAQAPALIISSSAAGREALPLRKAEVDREGIERLDHRAMCHGPAVQVVAKVPCDGPVPPPSSEVTPTSAPGRSAAGR